MFCPKKRLILFWYYKNRTRVFNCLAAYLKNKSYISRPTSPVCSFVTLNISNWMKLFKKKKKKYKVFRWLSNDCFPSNVLMILCFPKSENTIRIFYFSCGFSYKPCFGNSEHPYTKKKNQLNQSSDSSSDDLTHIWKLISVNLYILIFHMFRCYFFKTRL